MRVMLVIHDIAYQLERAIVGCIRFTFACLRYISSLLIRPAQPSNTENKNREWWRAQRVFKTTGELYGYLDSCIVHTCDTSVEFILKGWVFNPERKISRFSIPSLSSYDPLYLYGLERRDVREAFPSINFSLMSGFAVAASIPTGLVETLSQPLNFQIERDDGEIIEGSFSPQPFTPYLQ